MTAISDLSTLLASMNPELAPGAYVFGRTPGGSWSRLEGLDPVVVVREAEGWTVVVSAETALARGIEGAPMRMITLTVHSDLEAVGLTAAFATCLGAEGISANVVAGYHHDHIFVPMHQADRAMVALRILQADHVGAPG